ncbi:chromate transporter [Thermus sp.]|uniref:chromate transporter n=1 Tax=Thermus sp. TaxID=275 RepID=UPI00307F21C4
MRRTSREQARLPSQGVSLFRLLGAFFYVGLTAFGGGGSAHLYQLLVVRRGWLSEGEFLEAAALCRLLPGPVFANLAAHLGARLGGVLGGMAALVGVLAPGSSLMLLLSLAYLGSGTQPGPSAKGALAGVMASALGLMLATTWHQARIGLDSPKALLLALGVFLAYGLLHWPLPVVLLLAAPVGVALYWRESR